MNTETTCRPESAGNVHHLHQAGPSPAPAAAPAVSPHLLNAFAEFEAQVRDVALFARMVESLGLLRAAGGHVSRQDEDLLVAMVCDGAKDLEARYDTIWARARDLAGKAVQS